MERLGRDRAAERSSSSKTRRTARVLTFLFLRTAPPLVNTTSITPDPGVSPFFFLPRQTSSSPTPANTWVLVPRLGPAPQQALLAPRLPRPPPARLPRDRRTDERTKRGRHAAKGEARGSLNVDTTAGETGLRACHALCAGDARDAGRRGCWAENSKQRDRPTAVMVVIVVL